MDCPFLKVISDKFKKLREYDSDEADKVFQSALAEHGANASLSVFKQCDIEAEAILRRDSDKFLGLALKKKPEPDEEFVRFLFWHASKRAVVVNKRVVDKRVVDNSDKSVNKTVINGNISGSTVTQAPSNTSTADESLAPMTLLLSRLLQQVQQQPAGAGSAASTSAPHVTTEQVPPQASWNPMMHARSLPHPGVGGSSV